MLEFSIARVCEARGIVKPYRFLTQNGFAPTTATKLAKGDVEYLRLEYIEKLCILLNCQPNDLFEWTPATRAEDKPDHPLAAMRKSEKINLAETLRSLPMNKIKEIESLLANMK
jgi:DNA-binding Xre family transcriptional regulator